MAAHKQQVYQFIKSQQEAEKTRELQLSVEQKKLRLLELQSQQAAEQQRVDARQKNRQKAEQQLQQLNQQKEARRLQLHKSNLQMRQLAQEKPLFQKFEEAYRQKIQHIMRDNERKLEEIKKLKQPLDYEQIRQHSLDYLKSREQHALSSQASPDYRAKQHLFQSQIFKLCQQEEQEQEKREEEKRRAQQRNQARVKEFAQLIKVKHQPKVDPEKAQQVQEQIKHAKSTNYLTPLLKMRGCEPQDLERQQSLKKIGIEYLAYNKKHKTHHEQLDTQRTQLADLNSLTPDVTSRTKNQPISLKTNKSLQQVPADSSQHASDKPTTFDYAGI